MGHSLGTEASSPSGVSFTAIDLYAKLPLMLIKVRNAGTDMRLSHGAGSCVCSKVFEAGTCSECWCARLKTPILCSAVRAAPDCLLLCVQYYPDPASGTFGVHFNLLQKVLAVTVRIIQRDAADKAAAFNARPYFRLLVTWLMDLNVLDAGGMDTNNLQVRAAAANCDNNCCVSWLFLEELTQDGRTCLYFGADAMSVPCGPGVECVRQCPPVAAAAARAQLQLCVAGADEPPHAHAQAAARHGPQGLAALPASAARALRLHGALPGERRAHRLGELRVACLAAGTYWSASFSLSLGPRSWTGTEQLFSEDVHGFSYGLGSFMVASAFWWGIRGNPGSLACRRFACCTRAPCASCWSCCTTSPSSCATTTSASATSSRPAASRCGTSSSAPSPATCACRTPSLPTSRYRSLEAAPRLSQHPSSSVCSSGLSCTDWMHWANSNLHRGGCPLTFWWCAGGPAARDQSGAAHPVRCGGGVPGEASETGGGRVSQGELARPDAAKGGPPPEVEAKRHRAIAVCR